MKIIFLLSVLILINSLFVFSETDVNNLYENTPSALEIYKESQIHPEISNEKVQFDTLQILGSKIEQNIENNYNHYELISYLLTDVTDAGYDFPLVRMTCYQILSLLPGVKSEAILRDILISQKENNQQVFSGILTTVNEISNLDEELVEAVTLNYLRISSENRFDQALVVGYLIFVESLFDNKPELYNNYIEIAILHYLGIKMKKMIPIVYKEWESLVNYIQENYPDSGNFDNYNEAQTKLVLSIYADQ
ncbi:MAG: hypothetical protein OCD02_21350 [Spirochaetaceae bacterium]